MRWESWILMAGRSLFLYLNRDSKVEAIVFISYRKIYFLMLSFKSSNFSGSALGLLPIILRSLSVRVSDTSSFLSQRLISFSILLIVLLQICYSLAFKSNTVSFGEFQRFSSELKASATKISDFLERQSWHNWISFSLVQTNRGLDQSQQSKLETNSWCFSFNRFIMKVYSAMISVQVTQAGISIASFMNFLREAVLAGPRSVGQTMSSQSYLMLFSGNWTTFFLQIFKRYCSILRKTFRNTAEPSSKSQVPVKVSQLFNLCPQWKLLEVISPEEQSCAKYLYFFSLEDNTGCAQKYYFE